MYPTVHARYYIGPECPSIKKSSVPTSPVSLMGITDAGIWSFCLVALAIFCGPCRLPAESFTHVFDFAPANPLVQRNRLALLGTLRLSIEAPDGKPLHGLSGLAWLRKKPCLSTLHSPLCKSINRRYFSSKRGIKSTKLHGLVR